MKIIENMKMKYKLLLIIAVFLIGFLFFGIYSTYTLNKIKVNGPIYQNIIMGKDLVADILPPPEFIVETYLVGFQMLNEEHEGDLRAEIEKSKRLKAEYIERNKYWQEKLPEGTIKKLINEESYKPAMEFFDIMENEFIPAVQAGDSKKAYSLMDGKMKEAYNTHSEKLSELIDIANSNNLAIEKDAGNTAKYSTIVIVIIAVVILAVILMLFTVISRTIRRNIGHVKNYLNKIAGGDFSVKITKEHENMGDEIGEIVRSIVIMQKAMSSIFNGVFSATEKINNSSKSLLEISGVMAKNSEETVESTLSATKSLKVVSDAIESTSGAMDETSQKMNAASSAIGQMSSTINTVASASEQTAAGVTKVSELMEQIANNIETVSHSTNGATASLGNISSTVRGINQSLMEIENSCVRSIGIAKDAENKAQDTNSVMENLITYSKQVAKIVDVITKIASQTNMLALNAAIEAAGAGEAGKGFVVVANEVKDLAKKTADATDEISNQIWTMQSNIENAVIAVEVINKVIKEQITITNSIAGAVTEQSAATGKISEAVVKTSEIMEVINKEIGEVSVNAKNAARNSSEASVGVRNTTYSTRELSKFSVDVSENTERVAKRANEIAKTVNDASISINEVLQTIEGMSQSSRRISDIASETNNAAICLSDATRELENVIVSFKV